MNKLMIIAPIILFCYSIIYADSPGVTVGHSSRDQQTVGATINRCAVDSRQGAHVAWTAGESPDRYVYYNFIDETGQVAFDEGIAVSEVGGAGFPSVVADSRDAAAIAFHNFSNLAVTLGVDCGRGMGLFTLYDPPDALPGGNTTFWPRTAVDINGRYHILSIEHGMSGIIVPMIFTLSTDGGLNWEYPVFVDSIGVQAYLVCASRFDSKVAVVYARPRPMSDPDYYNNDVVYIESEDGLNWNFENKVNITNYQDDDSLRCFNSLDAVYDPDGNLHIIWTTPLYDQYTRFYSFDSCLLWHWSQPTGTDLVADGMVPSSPSVWDRSISSCNISVSNSGDLYATYVRNFDNDVSHAGYSNGEIYYTFSIDNGEFWFPEENLTNTNTNGCMTGDCDNDFQLTTADFVDGNLHIFYIDDKDAGMSNSGEGEVTDNPQLYLRHTVAVGIDDDPDDPVPGQLYLSPACPNPFNESAVLEYCVVEPGPVRLHLYNILGQEVGTLVDEVKSPGRYSVRVDGNRLTSGIYFAKLSSGDSVRVRKLTLLK
jgi:hypothetical protein